jgi:serine/threonine protein kinase/cold shock CspA family protein
MTQYDAVGIVDFFNDTGGYGFIQCDQAGEDVFFHMEDIGGPDLTEGTKVAFDIEQAEEGPRAINVVRDPNEGDNLDIELVADRTGVDQKVAEQALETVDGDLAAAVNRIESDKINAPDEDKSFRERVEEIREQRDMEPSTEGAAGTATPNENKSFEERVEEIRRQREQERREQLNEQSGHEPSSVHEDDSDESERGASVADIPESQEPGVEAVASPPRRPSLSHEGLTIAEEIGAGGQAIITEARLPEAKQPPARVALREPDTSATLTREAVEEFLSQAETWATVDAREREKRRWADSEHIVGVIATGDRQPWVAMEYMDGGDLEELLVKHPDGLPVGQALWTGACVCKGLEVAHNLGKVHLDVKPRNVLLRETDGWSWPKLADWGLSRTLAEETGTMEGLSVQYAAPEQFDSTKFGDPDQLTDIYQVGALVYALLTGEPPATGGQLEVMKTVIGEEPIAPPGDRRAELPPEVDAVVGLALEREKTDRYSSVSVFGDALHALRTGGRLPPAVAARLDE